MRMVLEFAPPDRLEDGIQVGLGHHIWGTGLDLIERHDFGVYFGPFNIQVETGKCLMWISRPACQCCGYFFHRIARLNSGRLGVIAIHLGTNLDRSRRGYRHSVNDIIGRHQQTGTDAHGQPYRHGVNQPTARRRSPVRISRHREQSRFSITRRHLHAEIGCSWSRTMCSDRSCLSVARRPCSRRRGLQAASRGRSRNRRRIWPWRWNRWRQIR
jgi:hypothetical protein